MKLFIHLDFTSGGELSHMDVKYFFRYNKFSHRYIHTNDLTFCDFEDIIIMKDDNSYLSLQELLKNDGTYCTKDIRKEHKLIRLLLNDYFIFKKRLGRLIPI